ncbi:MAG: hemerythrin family protein [Leptospiraceae bacterium]|nr:hemerythrin family protein [Leptospiraceae bacterium]
MHCPVKKAEEYSPRMQQIDWQPEWSFDIYSIDSQHQKLLELINQLLTFVSADREPVSLAEPLQGLLEYTQYHFDFEEKYFELYDFRATSDHCREHQQFKDRIAAIISNQNSELSGQDLAELIAWLQDWLVGHIQGSDREYLELFLEHNVR